MFGILKKLKKPELLAISLLTSFFAGSISSVFIASRLSSWYAQLVKPPLVPPTWLFGFSWTIMYILMATSLYMVWVSEETLPKKQAYIAYGVQLGLSVLWCLFFFGLKAPWVGFAVVLLYLGAVIWNILEFNEYNDMTSYLLFPYLVWVAFAVYLNLGIALLNK